MTADTTGGVWTYAVALIGALARHNIEVALATMGAPLNAEQRTASQSLDNCRLYESAYRLEWMNEPWEDVEKAGDWLLRIRDVFQPDCVHLNGFAHGSLPWGLPTVMAGHSCVYSWFRAVRKSDPPQQFAEYRRRVTRGLRAASRVTAPTGAMLDALRAHYGGFRSDGPLLNGCTATGMPLDKEPFVFAAGRLWDDAKNIRGLQQAGAMIEWPVFIAGQTDHPDGGSRRYDRVQSLGLLTRPQMNQWLGRASIYALPAYYEPFGLSVLEAAQAGCALVLGDISSLRELWSGAALFVRPERPESIGKAVQTLIDFPVIRRKLAEKAHQRSQRFTSAAMGQRYANLYRKVVSGHMVYV